MNAFLMSCCLIVLAVVGTGPYSSASAFPYSALAYLPYEQYHHHQHSQKTPAGNSETNLIGNVISRLAGISLSSKTRLEYVRRPTHFYNKADVAAAVDTTAVNNATEPLSSGNLHHHRQPFTAALTKRFAESLLQQPGDMFADSVNSDNMMKINSGSGGGGMEVKDDYGSSSGDYDLFYDVGQEEEGDSSSNFGSCLRDLQTIFSMAEQSEHLWARKLLDSWSKPPAGVYAGSLTWFGDFDECVNSQPPLSLELAFKPIFCRLGFTTSPQPYRIKAQPSLIQFPVALAVGICASSRCTATALTEIAATLVMPRARLEYPVLSDLHIVPDLTQCQQMEIPLDPKAYFTIVLFSVLGFIILAATILDIVIEFRATMRNNSNDEEGATGSGITAVATVVSQLEAETPDFMPSSPDDDLQSARIGDGRESPASSGGSTSTGSLSSSISTNSFFSRFCHFLICFSAYTNLRKLLSTSPASQPFSENLRCLNGIRVFSLCWIILAHAYFFLQIGVDNLQTVFDLRKSLPHQILVGSVLGVDTFFFLSGFLAYWTLAKTLNLYCKSSFCCFIKSLPYVYLNRYLRLTPPYMAMVLVSLCLWPYLSNGPYYFQQLDEYCAENWWTNFLYVNNIIHSDRMCVGWTWYLAVDMQLSLLAPFAVFLFQRWERLALILTAVLLCLQAIIAATLTVVFRLPSTLLPDGMQDMQAYGNITFLSESFPHSADYLLELTPESSFAYYFDMIYIKPLCWIAPYLVGILTGFLIAKKSHLFRRKLSLKLTILIWVLALVTIVLLIFGQWGQYLQVYRTPPIAHALYNALSRTVWALAIGWIVLASVLNKAGIINRFLAWSGWVIPAKLAYMVYLLHPLVIIFYVQTSQRAFHATDTTMTWFYFGTIFVTYLLSLVFSLAFEAPVLSLQRLYLRPNFQKMAAKNSKSSSEN